MDIQNKNDFINYFKSTFDVLKLKEADIIYLYSDFRFFSQYIPLFDSKNDFLQSLLGPIMEMDKTIITTTFSYTTEGEFDVLKTPTSLGVLNKWIMNQPGFARSEHPVFSYAAIGPQKALVENIAKSAFGKKSVFDRLLGKKTAFVHIGRPVELGNTSLHFVEQMCGATYRYNKFFPTKVFKNGAYIDTDYSANMRALNVPDETFIFDFKKATDLLRKNHIIQEVGEISNLSNISFYWYDSTIDLLVDEFYKDPCLFINSSYKRYD